MYRSESVTDSFFVVRNCVSFLIPMLLSPLLHVMLLWVADHKGDRVRVGGAFFWCVNCSAALPSFACTPSTCSIALITSHTLERYDPSI